MPSIMHNYTIMHKLRLASVGGIDGPIIGAKKAFHQLFALAAKYPISFS